MNGWDVVISIINQFPPVAMTLLLIASIVAVSIGIAGFSKHGMDFIKHGFAQNALGDLLDKLATKEDIEELRLATKADINKMETRIEKMETELGGMKTELATIKVNHFGHLKDFLTELTSILQDKGIFNNLEKTRLDNQLRGM